MNIKVLGTGCNKCKQLKANVATALKSLGSVDQVQEITDIQAILAYGVTSTPALVVDEKVILVGQVPTPTQLQGLLTPLAG